MSIKEILLQEIESSADSLLEETLDFLRFLKTKQATVNKDAQSPQIQPETAGSDIIKPQQNPTDNSQLPYRPASGRSIEEYVDLFLTYFLNLGKVADCSVDLNKVRSKLLK